MDQSKPDILVSKENSWRMFNEISPKYDLLNHILSFGMDIVWRKRLSTFLPSQSGQKILDLATGTADVLLSFFKHSSQVATGCGIDLAEKMLDIGRQKVIHAKLEKHIQLQTGDATHIPFDNNTFDAVSIAFGIRNVESPSTVLTEMHRVLKTGGRALILEFSLPTNIFMKTIHLMYLRYGIPFIGYLLSGHYHAYKYLNRTIETFPYGNQFCDLMNKAGFQHVKANKLLFGVATIYQGDKL